MQTHGKVELKKLGLHFILVDLGKWKSWKRLLNHKNQLKTALQEIGLELIDDKNQY